MLENLLRCIALPACSNYNVIAADEYDLVSFDTFPILIVANTGKRPLGLHWYGVLIQLCGTRVDVEIFDPLALDLKKHHKVALPFKPNKVNKVRIQSDQSDKCGDFVLMFFHYKLRGYSTSQFLAMFHHDQLEKNDLIVNKFILKLKRSCLQLKTCRLPRIGCTSWINNPLCIKQ